MPNAKIPQPPASDALRRTIQEILDALKADAPRHLPHVRLYDVAGRLSLGVRAHATGPAGPLGA